jgi:alpha-galactosidase
MERKARTTMHVRPRHGGSRRPGRLRPLLYTALAAATLAGSQFAGPVTAQASTTATSGDGAALAVTPPMGWNDWAHYQCTETEQSIEQNAAALVSTGLAAAGYNTVTIDDCWMASARDANGNLQANAASFPHGMAALGTYIHGLGLKFGIYEDAGYETCGGYPGSGKSSTGGADHFAQDAKTFASWGVDYLKLDGCALYIPSGQTQLQAYQTAYAAENTALKASGRDIVFSESAPAYFQGGSAQGTADWYSVLGWTGQYGQLWREGWDVATYDTSNPNASRFASVLSNYGYDKWLARYAGPGDWNDPDFLIAGDGGMTETQSQSQIALWSMLAAPLILSDQVSALSAQSVSDLTDKAIVAVDQDPLGKQAAVVSSTATTDILARPLANGDRAVALFNTGSSTATISTTTTAIGFPGGSGCTYTVANLWSGATSSSTGAISASVPSDGTAIFRLTPSTGCGTELPTGQIVGNGVNCMDDSGSGTADGNPIILYPCTGNANQRWTVNADGTVRTEGKCLSAQNGATTAGTYAVLSTCTGSPGQIWSYRQNGNLTDTVSGLCLDVYGGGTASGTRLDTWTCGTNQQNQIWSLPV